MRIPWREVEPLPSMNGTVEPVLSTVDALRTAWDAALRRASPEEFAEARQRNLRRHAIETGIIERLYDLDWGITEALVAEGITAEVAAREGGVGESTLRLIRDQLNALEYLTEAVREGRELSVFFVRELHQLITRHQPTYEARDALGNLVQVALPHGEWKTQPNHVRRGDGSVLEYTPPEHVQSQMERLAKLYAETEAAHPVTRAAWLHHRFTCIHPFADGNGRVARALTLLVLLQARYAPLVVDRRNRSDYIAALDAANDGDLRPLVRLFAQFEILALRAELERPAVVHPASGSAVDIARAYVQRIKPRWQKIDESAETLGAQVQERTREHLRSAFTALVDAFRPLDAETFSDIRDDTGDRRWRVSAVMLTCGRGLVYELYVDMVAGQPGVLRVDVFSARHRSGHRDEPSVEKLLDLEPTDSVTLLATDDLDARWPEIEDLIDRTLAAAVDAFARRLR